MFCLVYCTWWENVLNASFRVHGDDFIKHQCIIWGSTPTMGFGMGPPTSLIRPWSVIQYYRSVTMSMKMLITKQLLPTRVKDFYLYFNIQLPSVLWCCWLSSRKGIQSVKKTEWWGAGVVICLQRGADLHMAQLTPLPFTVSCFSKSTLGFIPFWYWFTWVVRKTGR